GLLLGVCGGVLPPLPGDPPQLSDLGGGRACVLGHGTQLYLWARTSSLLVSRSRSTASASCSWVMACLSVSSDANLWPRTSSCPPAARLCSFISPSFAQGLPALDACLP